METDSLKAIVELLDKITTIGILMAAWLWERRERTSITTQYLQDMRRLAARRAHTDDENEQPTV